MLCNRGVVHAARGSYPAADRDLRRADTLAAELDQRLMVAGIHQNLGWLADHPGLTAEILPPPPAKAAN